MIITMMIARTISIEIDIKISINYLNNDFD